MHMPVTVTVTCKGHTHADDARTRLSPMRPTARILRRDTRAAPLPIPSVTRAAPQATADRPRPRPRPTRATLATLAHGIRPRPRPRRGLGSPAGRIGWILAPGRPALPSPPSVWVSRITHMGCALLRRARGRPAVEGFEHRRPGRVAPEGRLGFFQRELTGRRVREGACSWVCGTRKATSHSNLPCRRSRAAHCVIGPRQLHAHAIGAVCGRNRGHGNGTAQTLRTR